MSDQPPSLPTQGWTAQSAQQWDIFKIICVAFIAAALLGAAIWVIPWGALSGAPTRQEPPRHYLHLWPTIEMTSAGLLFHGMPCTDACQGHRAGYCWAKKKTISKSVNCASGSNSFNEGCLAFVKHGASDAEHSAVYNNSEDDFCE